MARKKLNVRLNAARKRRLRAWYYDLMIDKKCVLCGFSDRRALQWAHKVGTVKLGNVTRLYLYSKTKALAEMAKCIILCANCHCIFDSKEN